MPTHIFSLSETAVRDAWENDRQTLLAHNRDYMMRAYPSAMRVNSSNMDPSFLWRQGIQIVALNWQHNDKGMMLNKGMFAGSNGWLLKPPEYRGTLSRAAQSSDKPPQGAPQGDTSHRHTLSLSIEVLAGQNLPLPEGDDHARRFRPYVLCTLYPGRQDDNIRAGGKDTGSNNGDDAMYKLRTKTCNGVDPDFGAQSLHFPGAPCVLEELSFLR